MLRFFLMLFLLTLIGLAVLSRYSAELSGQLIIFVSSLVAAAVVLKLSLDFFLHKRKKDEDSDSYRQMLDEPKVTSYSDRGEFNKVVAKRHGSVAKWKP